MRWPAPSWYEVHGYDTIGYEDRIVFPIDIRSAERGKPLEIRAALQWVACSQICIPIAEEVSLVVPVGPAAASDDAGLVDSFLRRVPADGLSVGSAVMR